MRYTETDLNRVFPDAETCETRLAHEQLNEFRGCTTLSMHLTRSYERLFVEKTSNQQFISQQS